MALKKLSTPKEIETIISKYGNKYQLSVDHDRVTGLIRGLLCSNCNAALGLVGDDVEILKNAIHYLERDIMPAREKQL